MKKHLAILALLALLFVAGSAIASASTSPNLAVCHPNNGENGSKGGWSLIGPDQASKHIDEEKYNATPQGEYWKHEAKDGRHDVYALEGTCPAETPPVDVCPNIDGDQATIPANHKLEGKNCIEQDAGDYTDGKECAIGEVVYYINDDPKTPDCKVMPTGTTADDPNKGEVKSTTPTPVEDTVYPDFQGK